jgi:hypothetical protein
MLDSFIPINAASLDQLNPLSSPNRCLKGSLTSISEAIKTEADQPDQSAHDDKQQAN